MLKLKVLLPILLLIFISALQAQTASDQTQPLAAEQTATAAPASSADFDHAMRQYRRGHYSEAIAEFNRVVAADPNNAAAYYFMGYAQYVTHHLPEALASFTQAFKVNPSFDPKPYFRGRG
jgi:Flp pilus assembly protein TadD